MSSEIDETIHLSCSDIYSIVFVHGLKGHPKKTWSANPEIDSSAQEQSPAKNRRSLKSLFRQKPTSRDVESVYSQTNPTSSKVFWLSDYLVDDIPEARIWTYGYNADVTGGLFESNNKNSISQHGRDLAVRLERDIENKVIYFERVLYQTEKADSQIRTLSSLSHTAWVGFS